MAWKSELRFSFSVNGGHDFEVVEFDLKEALSEPFRLDLNLASAHPSIAFGQVLDQPATLTIWRADHPVRYCSGVISSFTQGETGFRRTRYQAVVEPPMARLRLSSDWRIFQTLSVPQITEAVLKAHHLTRNYEQIITNEHLPREYCVQAGDTDYDFLERILREEGRCSCRPSTTTSKSKQTKAWRSVPTTTMSRYPPKNTSRCCAVALTSKWPAATSR